MVVVVVGGEGKSKAAPSLARQDGDSCILVGGRATIHWKQDNGKKEKKETREQQDSAGHS